MPPTPESKSIPSEKGGVTVVLPGQTPDGSYILSVLLKRTYDIVPNKTCTRADVDRALVTGDISWDDPMNSSTRYESDFVPFKLATDVVLNGKAYAPHGAPATSCRVAVQVGLARKEILVIGDRVARYVPDALPEFTDPVPFVTMDLRYELAYGGIDVFSDKRTSYPYPRNFLGRGFVVANSAKSVDNLVLPNLEDPNALLTCEQLCLGEYKRWEQQPAPAGYSWFPKSWFPRARLSGILPADRAVEQELRQAYAKLVPASQREAYLTHGLPDMNFHFFNGASSGLVFPYLSGGEQVIAEGLTREGKVAFRLPEESPRLGLDLGAGIQEPAVVRHTVMVRMEECQVDIVWRGAVPYAGPDWLPQMRKMQVLVT